MNILIAALCTVCGAVIYHLLRKATPAHRIEDLLARIKANGAEIETKMARLHQLYNDAQANADARVAAAEDYSFSTQVALKHECSAHAATKGALEHWKQLANDATRNLADYSISDGLEGHDWIAVDLDGTLAEYNGFKGPTSIGQPIPAMVERLKAWRAAGRKVCIFTARIAPQEERDLRKTYDAVKQWCVEHLGEALPITCIKHHGIAEFYDDRAYGVEKNTGKLK